MISLRNKIIALVFIFFVTGNFCLAQQEPSRTDLLKQEIKKAKTIENAEPLLAELLNICTKDNKFTDFFDFLKTLEKNKLFKRSPVFYYYRALAIFRQIQFLEENKVWQELFDNKEVYLADLGRALDKAQKLNTTLNPLALRLEFLQCRINQDDEKAWIVSLENLFRSAREYLKTGSDTQVIRDIADELYREKKVSYARKFYSIYVSKISQSDISQDELKKLAEEFLKENKTDLAVSLYGAYLEKISSDTKQDKGIIAKKMFDIATEFIHPGWQEGIDPFFAENVYKEIESSYGLEDFDEINQYRRAYNLERIKEFESSYSEYRKLIDLFPNYQDKDRIYFRLGIFSAYIFDNIDQARVYFLKVVNEFPQSVDYLNSIYHLGLLDHWQGNLEKAKEFYNTILEKTKDLKDKPDIVPLAETRLKEITEAKEIEYNLRMFLEAVLNQKEEKPYLRLALFARHAKDYLDKNVLFETISYFTDTACLQQEFTYLWSGQLGTNQNPLNDYKFETKYKDPGTKVVNVVLVAPSSAISGTIEMANIYNE
ncbi:MAG: hypothetical protein PHS93_07505 [Candidatus Omnitrophica bacterium]|nr:hypothetical protein [Candidatus Omnitrophota bacterium]MDD5352986.1 hypothetical protein [Candidatus Omnitrophota bacterium]MDD5550585.1 hypothetical protein [Candidatus Omnitrophota bacterium]